jgi:gamma-glutamyltranspeptidase/glutathione hydrolase
VVRNEHRLLKNHCGIFQTADTMLIQAANGKEVKSLTALDFSHSYPSSRSAVMGRNVVAASQPLAAQAGLRMLLKGGNAIDAGVATAMALTVVEPTACGLGSDAFAIIFDGEKLHGLNSSGRSPAGWTRERFGAREAMPERGFEAVTVPGAVAAWVELARRFGTLPLAVLAEPAGQAGNSALVARSLFCGPGRDI